ncbi:MAG: O-phospho-L-seryl-tRNA:Cys-tRNA synthase [Hadesarchaea archaeon]|nr:MAG: O-phospho-L-seryl-tRNA:Cys-tRNA synthase [Hadesarchaea archaeon]
MGAPAPERLSRYRKLEREFGREGIINLNPIQRGGILTPEARRALMEFGDGYSVCDWCPPKTPRLDRIEKPPIADFLEDLAEFLHLKVARVVTRCREGKFIAFSSLASPGDWVVVDSLAHYSTYLAAELAHLRVREVPHSGPPEFRISPEAYGETIERIKRETGKPPALVLLTHVDSFYGNLAPAEEVGKLCREKGIPFLLNAAYTAGVMPVDGEKLGADVLVSSGHKSWAASAPTGILALGEGVAERVLRRSEIRGDWSGRSFPEKELALLGCTVMGAPLVTLMASFPHVVERVRGWEEEVKKARYLVGELERIEGTRQLGERPKRHTLVQMESEGFYKVSQKHRRRGFFLYEELRERGIVGIQPGLTRHFKLNTYGLKWEEVKFVAESFLEIAKKYGLAIT